MAGVTRNRGAGLVGAGGVLIVRDEKTSGTQSGTFTSGAWQTRTLNTSQTNTITGASLATNQITLPAGTYWVMASGNAWVVNEHQLRLQNITDTSTALLGTNTSGDSVNSFDGQTADLNGVFTITGTKALELQHRCTATRASNGFGISLSIGTEVYAQVTIFKMS